MLQRKVIILTIAVVAAFIAFAVGALFGAHNLSARKSIVGAMCLAVSIIMYGSPLTIMVSFVNYGTQFIWFPLI